MRLIVPHLLSGKEAGMLVVGFALGTVVGTKVKDLRLKLQLACWRAVGLVAPVRARQGAMRLKLVAARADKGDWAIKEGAKFAVKYNTLSNDEYEIMLEISVSKDPAELYRIE